MVIGRLTVRNPAYVMPSLRKTLIQLLTELGNSIFAINFSNIFSQNLARTPEIKRRALTFSAISSVHLSDLSNHT